MYICYWAHFYSSQMLSPFPFTPDSAYRVEHSNALTAVQFIIREYVRFHAFCSRCTRIKIVVTGGSAPFST